MRFAVDGFRVFSLAASDETEAQFIRSLGPIDDLARHSTIKEQIVIGISAMTRRAAGTRGVFCIQFGFGWEARVVETGPEPQFCVIAITDQDPGSRLLDLGEFEELVAGFDAVYAIGVP